MLEFIQQVSARRYVTVSVLIALVVSQPSGDFHSFADANDEAPASSIQTERGTIRVPDGFTIERVAASPIVQHPMMANFDDQGRLFIAASAGKNLRTADLEKELPNFVRMIEDSDGDGVFDRSTIFADQLTLPMGVLWYRDSLYVTAPPNIWRMRDTDGDGVADQREILVGKFGYTGNAASIHGPFLSPGGRIYWCDGRHGHEFKNEAGFVTSRKRGSGIFSMRPDGSDARMFCGGGMDNPVEVDFWPTGEVIGTVNILYRNPRIDCMVHWQEGGVYPHQEASIAEFQRTGELLGPITKFGHVAVSGMCRYRSTVLGDDFKNNIFTTIFNKGSVIRSRIERSGGTFRTSEEEFLTSDDPDFHPTDIIEDADGSLLVIDTGGWFRIGCPTSQIAKPEIPGAIYRIRRAAAKSVKDPRGHMIDLDSLALEDRVRLLDDPRPAVVERVMEHVAIHEKYDLLLSQYFYPPEQNELSPRGRKNLVWAMAREINRERSGILIPLLTRSEVSEELRITVASALAESFRDKAALLASIREFEEVFLKAKSAAFRRSMARLIGVAAMQSNELREEAIRLGTASRLLQRLGQDHELTKQEPTDRETEHAIILAAIRIRDRENTRLLLHEDNPAVKRASLITLDQMGGKNLSREEVAALLDTSDESTRKAALDVISRHEGWAGEILNLLSSWLRDQKQASGNESIIRGFLSAQTSDPSVQELIAELLADGSIPRRSRMLLLEVVAMSGLEQLPEGWGNALTAGFQHPSSAMRLQAVQAAASFNTGLFDESFSNLAANEKLAAETRIRALRALSNRRTSLGGQEFQFLTTQLERDIAPLTRVAAARTMIRFSLSDSQRSVLAGLVESAGPMTLGILLQPFGRDLTADLTSKVVNSLRGVPTDVRLPRDEVMAILDAAPKSAQHVIQRLIDERLESSNDSALMSKLSSLTDGEPVRGRDIYFGRASSCSSCHRVEGKGGQVGPDLSKIGAIRNQRDLLEAIMFPSASFAREYKSWTIVTDRGLVHTGLITRETADSLIVRQADLTEVRIRRDSIEDMRESPKSVMPEGLYHRLSDEDLSHLLSFLSSLK